jgi:eukaryotic-like serine/threonine-protein kinase
LLTGVKPQGSATTGTQSRPSAVFSATSTLPHDKRDALAGLSGQTAHRLERLLRDELDVVVLKALATEPDDRYPSAVSLAADISAYLAGQPVAAKRPTLAYTARKFASRHRAAVMLGLLTMVCIVGLSGVSLWQADRAQTEAQRTKKVMAFITELLGKSDPNATDGKRITVTELLKGALPDLQARFADDPAAHRELLTTISGILQSTEDTPEAVAYLRAQRAHSLKHFGPESLEVATDDVELGLALFPIGENAEAIELLQQALRHLETLRRTDHVAYLNANVGLAMSYYATEKFDDARRAAAAAERAYPNVKGLTDDQHAWYAGSLQFVYSFDIRETARWLDVLARDKLLDKFGGAIQRATARCSYATALFEVGKNNEALAEMRPAVAELRRLTGDGSLIDETCTGDLGIMEMELMRVTDARQTMQRQLELIPSSKFQPRRDMIAQDYGRLGLLAMRALDVETAQRYWAQGRDAIEKDKAMASPTLLWLEAHLAVLQGQWPKARAALEPLHEMAKARTSQGASEPLVRHDVNLANVMRLEGDAAGAAERLAQAADQLKTIMPYQDARTARVEGYLALALIDLGRHDEAARLAGAATQRAAQWLAPDHPLTSQAKYIHALALDKMGQRESSAALMRDAQAAFQAKLGKPIDARWMRVLY